MPRRGGAIEKRAIANVNKVIIVASGKGGVGKSTIAVNLAFALAQLRDATLNRNLRVGILDLDIFGPSIPTLVGLKDPDEPRLTEAGAIIPLTNHGIPTMSMGYLLPKEAASNSSDDTPVVWRGLMVQKAVQQLLFDVDWTAGGRETQLDALVIDMPPGTGDVPLTLGQLLRVDGTVIVSTPQDVALSDVRKGVAMFRKVAVPITGILLNQTHFVCPSCTAPHPLFGSPEKFRSVAKQLDLDVLGELPLVPDVSEGGDKGVPSMLISPSTAANTGRATWNDGMKSVAKAVWKKANSS
ncbi:P-loop containing nucleoside triphosphate hydrolase protein [Pluteus cervinus]|uniref:P-loop containing nucleoside triphosphate hydrolase protein n=1 Tax=Pluteus cervinus TaxID=181527 RepID=A0ACD3AQY6_9AGAR|nr:P-loop containing nucleoside triphosphate hydrolase protein [Pluteus cervinus]